MADADVDMADASAAGPSTNTKPTSSKVAKTSTGDTEGKKRFEVKKVGYFPKSKRSLETFTHMRRMVLTTLSLSNLSGML